MLQHILTYVEYIVYIILDWFLFISFLEIKGRVGGGYTITHSRSANMSLFIWYGTTGDF